MDNHATTSSSKLPQVVIVGAGFGGLRAALRLANKPVQVTLVDQHNYHLFQPLLYQVATAGLSADEIAYPLRAILSRQRNARFRLARIEQIDLAQRKLLTAAEEIPYDYLVLAVGGVTNYFGMESIARNSFGLKSLEDARNIRNHLLNIFERASIETDPEIQRALLTFVVVGGGPTGVECAGAISELIRLVLSRDFPQLNFDSVRVILLEALDRLLTQMPPDLSQATLEALQAKRVEVRLNTAVKDFDGKCLTLQDGQSLLTHTLIWAAGIRVHPLLDTLDLPKGKQGRVKVLPTLQLADHPEVFVIGDAAYQEVDGQALPMVAPVAMQQGETAADNVMNHLSRRPLQEFVYKDPGVLATIGRNRAVAWLGRFKFKGFPAWVVWLVVHIMKLIGFRNRLLVLINWAWEYLFFDRANRIIER